MWDILIVEDDPEDRQPLVNGLKNMANCKVAYNGNEAIAFYKERIKKKQPFDFILLDVTMPNKDGFEVLQHIRALEENPVNPPARQSLIIIISSYKDSLMENYNMGWDDFITKPVDIKKLIPRMKALHEAKTK